MRYGYRRNRYYEGDREFEPNDFDDEDIKKLKKINNGIRGLLDYIDDNAEIIKQRNSNDFNDIIERMYNTYKQLHMRCRSFR